MIIVNTEYPAASYECFCCSWIEVNEFSRCVCDIYCSVLTVTIVINRKYKLCYGLICVSLYLCIFAVLRGMKFV